MPNAADSVHQHSHVEYGDHKAIHTPDGLVIILSLKGVGTQVVVYDDPEQNPIATIELRPRHNDGDIGAGPQTPASTDQ